MSGDAEVCHYCENESDDLRACEDWKTGEEVPTCPVCRRDFDLDPVGDLA